MSLLLKKRVSVLEDTLVLLKSLITEIEFSKTNLIKILSAFSEEQSMKNLLFLKKFEHTDIYSDFHSIWKEGIISFVYYKSEEKEKLLQLGTFLGTTDSYNQISTLSLYLTFFEKFHSNALAEYEKYGKISSLFGMFIGASVFVLLI